MECAKNMTNGIHHYCTCYSLLATLRLMFLKYLLSANITKMLPIFFIHVYYEDEKNAGAVLFYFTNAGFCFAHYYYEWQSPSAPVIHIVNFMMKHRSEDTAQLY